LHSPRGRSADRIAALWLAAGRAEWAGAADKLSGASSSRGAAASAAAAAAPTSLSQWLSSAARWYPRLPFLLLSLPGNWVPDWFGVGNLLVLPVLLFSFLGPF